MHLRCGSCQYWPCLVLFIVILLLVLWSLKLFLVTINSCASIFTVLYVSSRGIATTSRLSIHPYISPFRDIKLSNLGASLLQVLRWFVHCTDLLLMFVD